MYNEYRCVHVWVCVHSTCYTNTYRDHICERHVAMREGSRILRLMWSPVISDQVALQCSDFSLPKGVLAACLHYCWKHENLGSGTWCFHCGHGILHLSNNSWTTETLECSWNMLAHPKKPGWSGWIMPILQHPAGRGGSAWASLPTRRSRAQRECTNCTSDLNVVIKK